jgi:hypothetical protein
MESSKLQLSAEESAMVQDSHWLLTKNSIIQKAYMLFGDIATTLQNVLQNNPLVPEMLRHQSPKIAKGENYGGLPYVMLDYPRLFKHDETFAFRTMFWWGNFISVTWHLKGSHAEQQRINILHHYQRLTDAGFQLCINADEWRHDFEADNYCPLNSLTLQQLESILNQQPFIKLAIKIPLTQWNTAKDKVTEIYYLLLAVAAINFQDGETDPSPGSPRAGSDL